VCLARKRRIYDARATLHKSSTTGSSSNSSSSYSRYRSGSGGASSYGRDYDYDYYPSSGYGSGAGRRSGNRYQAFTFRNIFEGTPFHKLFGKGQMQLQLFWLLWFR